MLELGDDLSRITRRVSDVVYHLRPCRALEVPKGDHKGGGLLIALEARVEHIAQIGIKRIHLPLKASVKIAAAGACHTKIPGAAGQIQGNLPVVSARWWHGNVD